MAKQKTPATDTQAPEEAAGFQDKAPADTSQPQQKDTPPVAQGSQELLQPTPDTFICNVLRAFPTEQSLYVDRHGGAFTVGTAPALRGTATLYENPFYHPKKH